MNLMGFALGLVIGGGAALLSAPRSGREMRSGLRARAVESRARLQRRGTTAAGNGAEETVEPRLTAPLGEIAQTHSNPETPNREAWT